MNILKLARGQVLNRIGAKNGSGEGTEIRWDVGSIWVHLEGPFGVKLGSKTATKRSPNRG